MLLKFSELFIVFGKPPLRNTFLVASIKFRIRCSGIFNSSYNVILDGLAITDVKKNAVI